MHYRTCKTVEIESGHPLSKHCGKCQIPHRLSYPFTQWFATFWALVFVCVLSGCGTKTLSDPEAATLEMDFLGEWVFRFADSVSGDEKIPPLEFTISPPGSGHLPKGLMRCVMKDPDGKKDQAIYMWTTRVGKRTFTSIPVVGNKTVDCAKEEEYRAWRDDPHAKSLLILVVAADGKLTGYLTALEDDKKLEGTRDVILGELTNGLPFPREFCTLTRSTSVSRQKKITTPRGPEEPAGAGVATAESLVPLDTKPRQWTSRSGKVLGEGTFVGVKDGAVRIKLTNGKVGQVRIDKLSAADQEFTKQASLALEEAEELLVMEEEPRAESTGASVAPKPATPPMADATVAAWSALFGTALETGPRREGERESARMARELIRIAQISLVNVDPAFAKEITAFIDLQQERIGQCKKHDREFTDCDQKWAAKFAEMEQMARDVGSQAGSLQESQQAMAAVAILGGAQLTQERNAEVAAMNERWANVYAAYDKRSAPIFNAIYELRPTLEKKYQRRFVLP